MLTIGPGRGPWCSWGKVPAVTATPEPAASLPIWRRALGTVLVVAYPAAVYYGLREGRPRLLALAVLVLLLPGVFARVASAGAGHLWPALRPILPTLVLVGAAAISGDGRALLAVPALVSLGLLMGFGSTLRPGATPMVERFARLVQPDLSPAEIAYCRSVTVVWCGFFVLNAAAAATLAYWDREWWALYTGLVAYVLMGLLATVEYVVRKARFRSYGPGLHDRLLSSVFPPRPDSPESS